MKKKLTFLMFTLLLAVGWTGDASAQLMRQASLKSDATHPNFAKMVKKNVSSDSKSIRELIEAPVATTQAASSKNTIGDKDLPRENPAAMHRAPMRATYTETADVVHDFAWYDAITYQWVDGNGTHTSKITEPATEPAQMAYLVGTTYLDPYLPGIKYSAFYNVDHPYGNIEFGYDIPTNSRWGQITQHTYADITIATPTTYNYIDSVAVIADGVVLQSWGSKSCGYVQGSEYSYAELPHGWSTDKDFRKYDADPTYGCYFYGGGTLTIPGSILTGKESVRVYVHTMTTYSWSYYYVTINGTRYEYDEGGYEFYDVFANISPNNLSGTTVTPPYENGYTVFLVKVKDGTTAVNNTQTGDNYTYSWDAVVDYYNRFIDGIELLTDGVRVGGTTSNAGTVFTYTGTLNRFFFIGKGKNCYLSSLESASDRDLAPFYSMYEEFSPTTTESGDEITDFFERMDLGEAYGVVHDCRSVNLQGHYFSMTGKSGTTHNTLSNLIFYIPDDRGQRYDGTNETWRNYDHQPRVGLYTAELTATATPVADYSSTNRFYDVTCDWSTSLDHIMGFDVPETYDLWVVVRDEHGNIVLEELLTTTTETTYTYQVPQYPESYTIDYMVRAWPSDAADPVDHTSSSTGRFFADTNDDDVLIPGYSEFIALHGDHYESDFDINQERNYYRNFMTLSNQNELNGLTVSRIDRGENLFHLYRYDADNHTSDTEAATLTFTHTGNQVNWNVNYLNQDIYTGHTPSNKYQLTTMKIPTSGYFTVGNGNALGNRGFRTVTFTAGTDMGSTTGESADQMSKNDVTISSTNAAFGRTDNYRLYGNNATTTISVPTGSTISKIVITGSSTSYPVSRLSTSTGSYSVSSNVGTWTGDAASVVFTNTNSGQARASKIAVTIKTQDDPIPTDPGTLYWDFEEESDMDGWNMLDADGDGYNWARHYDETSPFTTHSGYGVLYSQSYVNNSSGGGTALTPNNWLISPEVTLGGTLTLWACGQDANYAAEKFGVFVCAGSYSSTSDFVQVGADITTTGNMTKYTFDLSQFQGQGYFAIRHYGVTDQFYLNIDDIEITGQDSGPGVDVDDLIDVSKIQFVDQFSASTAEDKHPYNYGYRLQYTGQNTAEWDTTKVSNPYIVPVKHSGSTLNGFYTFEEMIHDSIPELLKKDVKNGDLTMTLKGDPEIFYYTIGRKPDDANAYSRISYMQFDNNHTFYTEGLNYLSQYTGQTAYPGDEIERYDDAEILTGGYNEYISYGPVVWTYGYDRFYYDTEGLPSGLSADGIHNSYGAPVWKTGVGEVNVTSIEVQRQDLNATGAANPTTTWNDDNNQECRLYFLGVDALGKLPTTNMKGEGGSNYYEPYLFRVWVKSKSGKLRGYTPIAADVANNVGDHMIYNANDDHYQQVVYEEYTNSTQLQKLIPETYTNSRNIIKFGALTSLKDTPSDLEVIVRFYYKVKHLNPVDDSADNIAMFDFTLNDIWQIPAGSTTNWQTGSGEYGEDDNTVTLANKYYYDNVGSFLMLGADGTLTLPAFDRKVKQIQVIGRPGASSSVKENIFVGNTAVSTEATGSTGTNIFDINEDYQAIGTIYTLKVTNNYNAQITKVIVVFEEEEPTTMHAPKHEPKHANRASTDVTFLPDGTSTTTMTNGTVTLYSASGYLGYFSSNYIELYGSTNTISTSDGTITKIVFNGYDTSYPVTNLSTSTGSYTTSNNVGTWTGNASSVTFSASSYTDCSSIVVTVESNGGSSSQEEMITYWDYNETPTQQPQQVNTDWIFDDGGSNSGIDTGYGFWFNSEGSLTIPASYFTNYTDIRVEISYAMDNSYSGSVGCNTSVNGVASPNNNTTTFVTYSWTNVDVTNGIVIVPSMGYLYYKYIKVYGTPIQVQPTPVLNAPTNGSTVNVGTNTGSGVSVPVTISGSDLTQDLTISVSGTGFSVSPTTVTAAAANAGTSVTVTYDGTLQNAAGTLTITSGEVSATVNLTATYDAGSTPNDPVLITPLSGSTVFVGTITAEGESVSVPIGISGNYLTKDLTATVTGAGFSLLTRDVTVPYADVNAGTASVTVAYSGTAENATGRLNLSSDEVSAYVLLTASYREPVVLTNTPAGYVAEDSETPTQIFTGIIETLYEIFHGEVVDVIYYNTLGMSSKTPFDGINIVVTRYSDGTTSTAKVVR